MAATVFFSTCQSLQQDAKSFRNQFDVLKEEQLHSLNFLMDSQKREFDNLVSETRRMGGMKVALEDKKKSQDEKNIQKQDELTDLSIAMQTEKEKVKSKKNELEKTTEALEKETFALQHITSWLERDRYYLTAVSTYKEDLYDYYSKNLGLVIETKEKDGKLFYRFSFNCIDASNPDKEFYFYFGNDAPYEIAKCVPNLECVPAILEELKRSKDLFCFLRSMRQAFVESTQNR